MRNEQYGNKLLPKQSANEYADCKSKMLLQLDEYETAPNFIQLKQNLTSDCFLV